jgi:hypothetical protein
MIAPGAVVFRAWIFSGRAAGGGWSARTGDCGSGDQFVLNPALIFAAQKSGLSARGTAASFPEYHLVFSAQTDSTQSPRPRP